MLQPATSPYRVVADVAVYDTEQRKEGEKRETNHEISSELLEMRSHELSANRENREP
jgi:hypothetical protein